MLFRGQNKNQYEGGTYIRSLSGIGDAVFMIRYALPAIHHLPFITLNLGVKFANASIDGKDVHGKRISDNLQLGSGSVDPIFGVNLLQQSGSLLFSGNAYARITSRENIFGYKYGNELHVLSGIDYSGEKLFYGGLQLYYLKTTRDYYQYGKVTRERGGKWVYLVPKLGVNIWDNLQIELSLMRTIYQFVNESQLTSKNLIRINTIYSFSL